MLLKWGNTESRSDSMEKIVDLPCKCGRIYCRSVDDDDNKNEIVSYRCECGNVMEFLIAERTLK